MRKISVFILLFTVLSVNAQNKNSYSLKDALDYAVINSINSKNVQLDKKIGKEKITDAITMGLPRIDAEATYLYYIKPNVFIFPNVFGPVPDPNSFTTVNASPLNNLNANITAAMPVVNGQYFVGIQAAKEYSKLLNQQEVKTNIGVKEEVTKAYYLVLIAQRSKKMIDSVLITVDDIVRQTSEINKEGLIEELDVKQLKLVQSQTQSLSDQLDNNIKLALYALKFQMGYPVDQEIELTDNLDALIASNNFDMIVKDLKDTIDYRNNIDYLLVSQQLKMQGFQYKLQMASAYPSLSTFFQVGVGMFNNQRWLPLEGTQSYWNGIIWGFNLKVPIFSSWNRVTKLKTIKLEIEKTKNYQYFVEQGVKLGYVSSKTQVENAYKKYKTAEDNMNLAAEIRRVNGVKFKEGLINSLALSQADQQFFDAQQKYFQAMFDLLNAKIELDKSMNKF